MRSNHWRHPLHPHLHLLHLPVSPVSSMVLLGSHYRRHHVAARLHLPPCICHRRAQGPPFPRWLAHDSSCTVTPGRCMLHSFQPSSMVLLPNLRSEFQDALVFPTMDNTHVCRVRPLQLRHPISRRLANLAHIRQGRRPIPDH